MDLSDDFRRNAAECLKRSREARTVEAQAEWLSMADFWLQLAQHGEERQEEERQEEERRDEERQGVGPASHADAGRSETGRSN